MSRAVGEATLRAVEGAGVEIEYDTLADRYREAADGLIRGYETDAAFNGLDYDRGAEREQVATYADALGKPEPDTRLPAWRDAPVTPAEVGDAARADLAVARDKGSRRTDRNPGKANRQRPADPSADAAPGED